jgi:hypothetical protein
MGRIVNRTNQTLMLDRIPTDLQGTDVMFMSSGGQRRGVKVISLRRRRIESSLVLIFGIVVMWSFAEIFIRAGVRWGVVGMIVAVVWGAFMGYLHGRDLKGE